MASSKTEHLSYLPSFVHHLSVNPALTPSIITILHIFLVWSSSVSSPGNISTTQKQMSSQLKCISWAAYKLNKKEVRRNWAKHIFLAFQRIHSKDCLSCKYQSTIKLSAALEDSVLPVGTNAKMLFGPITFQYIGWDRRILAFLVAYSTPLTE